MSTGSRNAPWFQLCAISTPTGNPSAAAPHLCQSAPSTSTGSLNATAPPLPSGAPSTLMGNPNVPSPAALHHQPAPSTSTGSRNAPARMPQLATTQPELALAMPSQLALDTSPSHPPPTPRFRQLHQQPCPPSQPRSSEPAWSPPSCKGRPPPEKDLIYWPRQETHSLGNLLQKCGTFRRWSVSSGGSCKFICSNTKKLHGMNCGGWMNLM